MPTTKERKPPKPCPVDLNDWVHTHTIADNAVMKVVDPLHPTKPTFWNRDGNQVWNFLGKAIPVVSSDPEEAEVSVLSPPPSVPTEQPDPPALPEAPMYLPGKILLHAELAQAVLRAAAWPVYGESHGHGQGSRGESADLQQQLPDGSWNVRVCDPRLPGGFAYIRVPEFIEFEVVEGEV